MWSLHHVTVLNIVVLAKWDGKVCSGIKLALRTCANETWRRLEVEALQGNKDTAMGQLL